MAIAIPLLAAGIAAGATVYGVHEQRKSAEEAAANMQKNPMPGLNPQPDESSLTSQQLSQSRSLLATGRAGTVLAPVGLQGSPLGSSQPMQPTLGGKVSLN